MAGEGCEDGICEHSVLSATLQKGRSSFRRLCEGEIGGDLIDVQPKLDMSRADFEVLPAFGVVLSAIVCCSHDFLFS